jgi:glycosyltransferase involved in cell wall biosynthesis
MLLQLVYELNMTQSVNALIVGNGEEKVMLMDEAARLGVDERVWFYGDCYDEELISELLFNADVCISPGNVGLTAIHSLTYGCPVITHDDFAYQGPEFEVILEGNTGAFFKKENIKSLVSVTERWLCDSFNKRNRIRQQCYDVIDAKWNPNNQIKILKKVFQE